MRGANRILIAAAVAFGLAGTRSAHAVTIPDASSPSLIVGSNGLGMFAYYDRVSGDLMVGRCLDAACTTITTSVVDSAGDVGRYPSITPGTSATLGPVISYEDTTNHRLKLALCADESCAAATTVVVAPSIGDFAHGSAVVLGSDGRPLVAYLHDPPPGTLTLSAAHCDNDGCTAITTTALAPAFTDRAVDIAIGSDGLALIAYNRIVGLNSPVVLVWHCANQACTSISAPKPLAKDELRTEGFFAEERNPALAGLPAAVPTIAFTSRPGGETPPHAAVRRGIQGQIQQIPSVAAERLDVAIGSDDRPRLVVRQEAAPGLDFIDCLDATCATRERTCLAGVGREPSLIVDGAGQALVAHEIGESITVSAPSGSCAPVLAIAGNSRTEGSGPLSFTVNLGPAQTTPVTVQFATADGTALAGADYVAASGTITFPPGSTEQTITVEVLPDLIDETARRSRLRCPARPEPRSWTGPPWGRSSTTTRSRASTRSTAP